MLFLQLHFSSCMKPKKKENLSFLVAHYYLTPVGSQVCVYWVFYGGFEPEANQNKLEQSILHLKTKSGNVNYSLVKRCRGGQGAPTTVLQTTAGLSYLGTTPDRVAGISCCWHCLSQSCLMRYTHTHAHTHTCWPISAFIWHCWASTCLGLSRQVASKHPPWWAGTASQPDNYHPLSSHGLPAEVYKPEILKKANFKIFYWAIYLKRGQTKLFCDRLP